MRKKYNIIYAVLFITAGTTGCSEDNFSSLVNNDIRHPINISSVYPSVDMQTRANIDGGFASGDAVGIFVVDRNADGEAIPPMLGSGRASNMMFILGEDGTWKGATQLYWDSKGAAADFYGYYPFNDNLSSVTNYDFVITPQQGTDDSSLSAAGYNASDLLWAKKENVEQTVETISLQYKHLMAGVMVRLEMGTGFSSTEWAELEKTVLLRNTVTTGNVNLATGEVLVFPDGDVKDIFPLTHNGVWRAVIFPQTVASGKTIISVTIDGQSYALKKDIAMSFLSGKMHTFTITVDRSEPGGQFTFSCSDESITPWMDDAELHEGLVREYVVLEVSEPGKLAEDLANIGKDFRKVEALKVVGTVNQTDVDFIATMEHLTDLNMQKCIIEGGVLNGLRGSMNNDMQIKHFIFPEKGLKVIGDSFLEWSHLSGSLLIPEGVERIENRAFSNCKYLSGSLSLPSTLKYIGRDVLGGSNIHSEFHLPDGLEEYYGIGGNYTGVYYIPSSMRILRNGLPSTLTGTLYFPQGVELDPGSAPGVGVSACGTQCTSVIFYEGMTWTPDISDSEIRGVVKIPSTVTHMGNMAGSKISGVIFPENLLKLGNFNNCSRLSGTIEIPKKIAEIPSRCFENCLMLTGVVISDNVMLINEYAFSQCINLNSIVCEGKEPPLVADNAFLGVPKDNFTIEVPKGCVEKYRNARGWGDFKRIAEYSNFVCRPAQMCALNSIHSEEMVLNADGPWTVARKPDWCTLSKESGTGKTALTINILPLSHGAGTRVDTLVFTMQSGGKDIETGCILQQYDYEHEEDSYITLQKATKGNNGGIDIVFAGDGYDGASIADGSYLDLVEYQTECFFAVEPYRSMREYFNVYVTFPLSQEKGVNTMYTYVNNRFGTLYGMNELTSSCTSTSLITESDEVMDYVVEKTPVKRENLWRTVTILVPNSTDYDGHTEYMENGAALSICPPSDKPYPKDTRGVIQHEAGGHGFGKLGDEEIVRNKFASPQVKQYVEDMHGRGWYQNLATTGKLSQVPWAEFIFDTDYSDYVDVYEGGYGYTRGIYRPEVNSCMNYGIPYYNTPSRLNIYRRIKEYASEEYRMEDFRSQDTFEWGPTTVTRSEENDFDNLVPYASGNHLEPRIVDFKRMGNEVRRIREKVKNERIKNEK